MRLSPHPPKCQVGSRGSLTGEEEGEDIEVAAETGGDLVLKKAMVVEDTAIGAGVMIIGAGDTITGAGGMIIGMTTEVEVMTEGMVMTIEVITVVEDAFRMPDGLEDTTEGSTEEAGEEATTGVDTRL